MNLITSSRVQDTHLRFEIQGRWEYNDALTLAYQIKAAAQRDELNNVLVDAQRVQPAQGVHGKFYICDRLRRALPPGMNVALIAPVEMVDLEARHNPAQATVVLFNSERAALLWLLGVNGAAIKNPPVLRSEG